MDLLAQGNLMRYTASIQAFYSCNMTALHTYIHIRTFTCVHTHEQTGQRLFPAPPRLKINHFKPVACLLQLCLYTSH